MELKMIDITKLDPNPLQPRESFEREKLKELAGTISDVGILQPIFVRPKGDRYEIIGGERRWKASQIAGEKTIPALVKNIPDSEIMVQSLIENVHREDLKPVEQAKAILEVFKAEESAKRRFAIDDRLPQKINMICWKLHNPRYKGDRTLTKEETALYDGVKKIGLGPHAIYESLRILKLPKSIQREATEREVGKRHLVRIAGIEDERTQAQVFRRVVEEDLSEKETSKLTQVVKDKKVSDVVKQAVLEEGLDVEVAREFVGLPAEGIEQVTKEVLQVQDRGKEYQKEHIAIRKAQAEGRALPDVETRDVEATIAKSYIEMYSEVHNVFVDRIIAMPKKHQDNVIMALLSAHGCLERQIQALQEKGLLSQDQTDGHRAKYAKELVAG